MKTREPNPPPSMVIRAIERHRNLTYTFKSLKNHVFSALKMAAVLVPLYYRCDGELMVLLTVRSSMMRTHANQVSFPGGVKDDEDRDEVDTCLREAQEEIGLPPSQVNIVGSLLPRISMHGVLVMPVVGFIPDDFRPAPNTDEVSSVFSLPLSRFLSDRNHFSTTYTLHKRKHTMHTFDDQIDGYHYRTWGLTAAVCTELAVAVHNRPTPFVLAEGYPQDARDPYRHQIDFLKEAEVRYGSDSDDGETTGASNGSSKL